MYKFFVVSDVHGFYDEMREALDAAGYDPINEKHYLISCGDNFDRGPKNLEVQKFLMNTPRTILVRGNHEDLFDWAIQDGITMRDYSNGTVDTIMELGGKAMTSIDEVMEKAYRTTRTFFDRMVDFFETENYVFVHGWIPSLKLYPDWRKASTSAWEKARWINPFKAAKNNGNKTGKILVHGHWTNSEYWAIKENRSKYGNDAKFDIAYHDNCIGLDACTALTHKINVLVIEDEFLSKEKE